MTKCIVWEKLDGSIAITHLHPKEVDGDMIPVTDEDTEAERARIEADPAAFGLADFVFKSYSPVEDIPTDREFREAWKFDEGERKVKPDLVKSKEIKDKRVAEDVAKRTQVLLDQHKVATITGDAAALAAVEDEIRLLKDTKDEAKIKVEAAPDVPKVKEVDVDVILEEKRQNR